MASRSSSSTAAGGSDSPQKPTKTKRTRRKRRKARAVGDMSRQMGESHRRFLQTMMVSGVIDEQAAKALYQYCCETHHTQYAPDKLEDFIDTINSRLQPMFMQIRKGMSENNGLQYYALVNMAETDITRMSSDYADNELELFRKTLDLIVCSENGKASSTDILNSTDSMTTRKMKKSETEHLLSRLVHDKWLSEGTDGLGIEAPLESLCPCPEDAEPSTRLQKLEQFVARMGRVLQYLRCSSPASPGVGVLKRGESNPAAAFCCTDHSLESFLVLHTAVPEPRCHVLCEDALHSACIENPEDLWRDPELPQLS
uniref:Non-structural maintenance of chromosomes element 1 homolog n=1 Tax=Astatotilapia calliptera TaxID=8154 RepID=A0AAX7TS20_ASTCA